MRIVVVHNFYRQWGGEDAVFNAESALLEQNGHEVFRYTVSNEDVKAYSKMKLAGATLWNDFHFQNIRKLYSQMKPDIVHVHNTLPLLSPSIYYASMAENIPTVQMMHNYRPFCLNGVLYRDGKVCEDCIGHYPISGLLHKCYRGSAGASLGVFSLYIGHFQLLQTYQRSISVFITSTQFARHLLIRMGLDEERIVVKPNLVNVSIDNNLRDYSQKKDILFVGRLDNRKGIQTLLSAIEKIKVPLVIAGDGDLRPDIETWLKERPTIKVEITGWLEATEVIRRLKSASMLIFPSEFYESFGNVIVEAFSCGTPVVTTSMGAQAELVRNNETGLIFRPGDPVDLAEKINWLRHHPEELIRMGQNARKEYEQKYTPERNYQMLIEIYQKAIRQSKYKSSSRINSE